MICFHCKKTITQIGDDRQMMVPIERPVYGNLNFHKDTCYQNEVKSHEQEYMQEHVEEIIAWLGGIRPNDNKKTKRK